MILRAQFSLNSIYFLNLSSPINASSHWYTVSLLVYCLFTVNMLKTCKLQLCMKIILLISEWFIENKLSLSRNKSCYTVFGASSEEKLRINLNIGNTVLHLL